MVLKLDNKEHEVIFVYRTITVFGTPFQGVSTNQTSPNFLPQEYSSAPGIPPTLPSYNPFTKK